MIMNGFTSINLVRKKSVSSLTDSNNPQSKFTVDEKFMEPKAAIA